MMTTTETRPPFLQAILDERSPKGKAQGSAYAVDTSPKGDLYSVGFDSDGADVVSYHDARMKKLEEFKETAEQQNPHILPDGSLVDEYSDGTTTLISVKLANGYSYDVSFPKSDFFERSIGPNGEMVTKDKLNGSSMQGVKVEGNRWYHDISEYKPSVTKTLFLVLENGKVGLQFQKDGRVTVSFKEGHIESDSFFIKTAEGAILTCDGKGDLILADPQKLPKDISEQDRAAHIDYTQRPTASIDTLIASPIPREMVKQEHQIAAAGRSLQGLGVEKNSLQASASHTTRLSQTRHSSSLPRL